MRLSRRYPVPADLALLYEFVNSLDERRSVCERNGGAPQDEIGTVDLLERWMRLRGLLGESVKLDTKCHNKALELRRALRAFLRVEPSDRRGTSALVSDVNAASADFPLTVEVSAKGVSHLRPVPGVRAGGLGAIVAELHHASETGKLDRLKMCSAEECAWAFYDRSKPSTRRWCSSTTCGNRDKTRAYRLRLRER